MAKSNALGSALYLELRRGDQTSQVILSPQVYNPVTDKTQKGTIITRQISETNPKRSWRYYEFKATPMLEKTEDIDRTVATIKPLLDEVTPFFVGYVSGGWELFQTPIAVELSSADLDDLAETKTPSALIRRLVRARTEAGYPEELFKVAEPEPTGYASTMPVAGLSFPAFPTTTATTTTTSF